MPPASRPLMLVGALQGIVLWFLWHASETPHWPQGSPMLMGALLWASLAVPAAIYLSEDAGFTRKQRGLLVLAIALLYVCLGAYAGWLGNPIENMEKQPHYGSFSHVLAVLVLGFTLVPLVAGYKEGRWHYATLFRLAWRNALLSASVIAITGLFWAVLFAGAMLMKSLGLEFVRELIEKPIFSFPITGIVIGAVFAQGHARSELLINLRQYWLSLNAWLLPLLLGFGVMWVVALPLTGLETLFATRSAAFILLWFAALAVHFINCAWQDGEQAPLYPRWLASGIRYAWLTLPVVTLVAGWALWLRIQQYGLTEERIWAVFIWLLALGYAISYGLSLLPFLQKRWMPHSDTQRWMSSVGSSNILMAVVMLGCLLLMASPAADPRRLAVNDQVARLKAGQIAPADFDYSYLRWRSERWGLLALQQLATEKGDARLVDIASRARQSLAEERRWNSPDDKNSATVLTNEEARLRIRLLKAVGSTDSLPNNLLEALKASTGKNESFCLNPQYQCAVWMQDFNNDGQQEALVLVVYAANAKSLATASLWAEEQGTWAVASQLESRLDMSAWTTAIESGNAHTQSSQWHDVVVNGKAMAVPGRSEER